MPVNKIFAFLILIGASFFLQANAYSNNYQALIKQQLEQASQFGCADGGNQLTKIICDGSIRIGVRDNYKGFGFSSKENDSSQGEYNGFEIELAHLIGKALGVKVILETVTSTDRIQKLLDSKVDIVLATMAHTAQREKTIDFVRPHYYSSPTAVIAPKKTNIQSLDDLKNVSICVPLGSYSNVVFSQHSARLMIYDRPDRMITALRLGACRVLSHDRSLLITTVTGPDAPWELSSQFEEKLTTTEVPWGIGVRKADASSLGKVISEIIADLHQDGTIEALAKKFNVQNEFLLQQKKMWGQSECLVADAGLNEDCMLKGVTLEDEPTLISKNVLTFQGWLNKNTGWTLSFPMLTGQVASSMFIKGMMVSILLVISALVMTLLTGLCIQFLLRSQNLLYVIIGRIVSEFCINSPIVLLLVLGYLISSLFVSYSPFLSIFVATVVIGLSNGSNAGLAMFDTSKRLPPDTSVQSIVRHTFIPIRASLINAAKTSPVAAIIGAPELLSVLTDVTSFTGERITTYLILSIFYILIVQAVVIFINRISSRLQNVKV